MDLAKLLEKRELCINDNPPACVALCPIHVDVKAFMGEVQKGDFTKAYEILERRMPMVRLIARVCDHPCQTACVRDDKDASLAIHEVEKAIVEYGYHERKQGLAIPANRKKVAIIGGGISGLTCALDLESKGYSVSLYERDQELGGRLKDFLGREIPQEIFAEEMATIKRKPIKIQMTREIGRGDLEKLRGENQAVLLATGKWQDSLAIDKTTLATELEGVFAAGRIASGGDSIIYSVSTGKIAARSIDRYVQQSSLTAQREKESSYETDLEVDTAGIEKKERINPTCQVYSKGEAIEEASRCLLCECALCYKACPHLQDEKLMPKEYIRRIHHNERVILGDRYANKTINSCMVCGLCKSVCPTGLDMAEIIRDTRKSMVAREKMPPSAHDFALKDMAFSSSEYFRLLRHEKARKKSHYLFFPGCQLSSSYPQYVDQVYGQLVEKLEGGVGLYLNCCGAPGEWSGREDLFGQAIGHILADWESMGRPKIIPACSSCYYIFENYLPQIERVSLWGILNQEAFLQGAKMGQGKRLLIHDSCTARDYENIYLNIRGIARKLGYDLLEPEYSKERTQCCGYGGLAYFANKEFSQLATRKRLEQGEEEYLAYCAMCRDLFLANGKKTLHILDLIFGENLEEAYSKKGPSLSERRSERLRLKIRLLRKYWGEKLDLKEEYGHIKLIYDEDIRDLMEERLILEADIKKVIGHGERHKNIFINEENHHRLAFRRIINVTFWVEYIKLDRAYQLITIYSHRMDVQGE